MQINEYIYIAIIFKDTWLVIHIFYTATKLLKIITLAMYIATHLILLLSVM